MPYTGGYIIQLIKVFLLFFGVLFQVQVVFCVAPPADISGTSDTDSDSPQTQALPSPPGPIIGTEPEPEPTDDGFPMPVIEPPDDIDFPMPVVAPPGPYDDPPKTQNFIKSRDILVEDLWDEKDSLGIVMREYEKNLRDLEETYLRCKSCNQFIQDHLQVARELDESVSEIRDAIEYIHYKMDVLFDLLLKQPGTLTQRVESMRTKAKGAPLEKLLVVKGVSRGVRNCTLGVDVNAIPKNRAYTRNVNEMKSCLGKYIKTSTETSAGSSSTDVTSSTPTNFTYCNGVAYVLGTGKRYLQKGRGYESAAKDCSPWKQQGWELMGFQENYGSTSNVNGIHVISFPKTYTFKCNGLIYIWKLVGGEPTYYSDDNRTAVECKSHITANLKWSGENNPTREP